jgi:transposase InsO family protein
MGAVLSQVVGGEERIIGYISRGLKPFEKNYSAYLLELAAAEWAIDYFNVYLSGRRFVLHTDHRPLTALGTIHKKTLNRLQQQLLEHNFEIRYKKGGENVIADALSRNPVDVLTDSSGDLASAQAADPFCQDLRKFLEHGELPEHSQGYLNKIKRLGPNCKIENDILFYWHKREHFRTVWCAIVPEKLRHMITEAAHNTWHGGHGGVHRTVNRICQSYYWPGMHKYVQDYISTCPRCQEKDNKKPPASPLRSLPICEGPNERVHVDLFGPMKSTSPAGNKYVCVMTDAYTKIVELAPIPDKSAETVAKCIFEKWICRYAVMIQLVTDNGLEFCNKVLDTLCELLGIKHKRTSSYHPASNSSAESFNRSMRKYLLAMLNNNETLNWEPLLPMLQLSYNCHIHQSTHESPFWLTYHFDPRLPYFDLEKPRPLYSDEYAPAVFKAFSETHKRVHKEQWQAKAIREEYYNRKTKERDFQIGERVLFYVTAVPRNANAKFFKHWQGPYTITQKFSPLNYEIKLTPRSKPILVHVEKIKHFQEEERQRVSDSKPPQHFCNDRSEELEGEEVTPAECVKHAEECNQNGFVFKADASEEELGKNTTLLQRQLDSQTPESADVAPALASERRLTRAAAKVSGDRLLSPLRNSRI